MQKIINGKFGTWCDKFCNSLWYSVAIAVVCIFAHMLEIPVVGAVLLTVLVIPALLFCKNSFVLVPFMLMCSFVLSENTNPQTGYYTDKPAYLVILCLLLAVAVAALIFHLFYYKRWRMLFKRAYLTVSLIIITVALWLSGVGSATLNWTSFGLAIAIAATMFLPYALIVNCGIYEGEKTLKKLAYVFIIAAAVIAIDYFELIALNNFNMDVATVKNYLKLGFVGPNTGSAIITIAIPLTFYLVYSCKRGFLWLIAVVAELFVIIITYSRASLVVALPGIVIVSIVLCFKQKTDRLGYWIAFGICVVGAVAVCIAFRHVVVDQLKTLFEGNTTGSGRTTLWKTGFEAWKTNPIFGVGFSYLLQNGHWYYSFHCTPLTFLYCGGVVAFAAYAYHRYKSVRLVFSAKLTAERVFVALTVLAMLCNALLDIAMTSATHLVYYSILIAIIEHDVEYTKQRIAVSENNVVKTTDNDNNILQAGKQNEL